MIKIRVEGLPHEVEAFTKKLKEIDGCEMAKESKDYRNRGNNVFRRYINIDVDVIKPEKKD